MTLFSDQTLNKINETFIVFVVVS